jgi:putative phosphoesterase
MKLGLISDIHGNLDNLKRAYALLRRLGVDAIVCAGDLADGEREGAAVIEYVREQGTPCVQGNHDYASSRASAADWHARREMAGFGRVPESNRRDILSDEQRVFLERLPLARTVDMGDKRVLLAHASPWDQTTYVFPNGRVEYFQRIAEEASADVVVLGHTHTPMAVEVEGVWVLNPGSVDGNRAEPYLSTCAVFDLDMPRYRVYDIHTGKPTVYPFMKLGDLGRDMHQGHGG